MRRPHITLPGKEDHQRLRTTRLRRSGNMPQGGLVQWAQARHAGRMYVPAAQVGGRAIRRLIQPRNFRGMVFAIGSELIARALRVLARADEVGDEPRRFRSSSQSALHPLPECPTPLPAVRVCWGVQQTLVVRAVGMRPPDTGIFNPLVGPLPHRWPNYA